MLDIRCKCFHGRRETEEGPHHFTEVTPLRDDLLSLEHLNRKRRPFSLVSVVTRGGHDECDLAVHLDFGERDELRCNESILYFRHLSQSDRRR